ncbi:MAG: N-6 DNA methylase, partial [Lentisphaeria bacterium]|nr:N-6 DNA methylase [Lentisphaeria bacterium]
MQMAPHLDLALGRGKLEQAELFRWVPESQMGLVEPKESCGLAATRSRASLPSPERAKALGAYYTSRRVADFLVRWAIRGPADCVLDPAFGNGVFLEAAADRIRVLGGDPGQRVAGVELDEATYSCVVSRLADSAQISPERCRHADFFTLSTGWGVFDAVVGNPPFIRYQRFAGQLRRRALDRALAMGVTLPALTSSWAPFVVHAASMLRDGGRMGLVVPFEAAYSVYARPLLGFLADSFGNVSLLTFQQKLFPYLSEDTMLLLAEGKGGRAEVFECFDFEDEGSLPDSDGSMPMDL